MADRIRVTSVMRVENNRCGLYPQYCTHAVFLRSDGCHPARSKTRVRLGLAPQGGSKNGPENQAPVRLRVCKNSQAMPTISSSWLAIRGHDIPIPSLSIAGFTTIGRLATLKSFFEVEAGSLDYGSRLRRARLRTPDCSAARSLGFMPNG